MKINRFLFFLAALIVTSCDFQATRLKVLRRLDPRIVDESDSRNPVEIRRSFPLLRRRNFRLAHAQSLLQGASHTLKDAEKKVHPDYSAVIAKIDEAERDLAALLKQSDAEPTP